MNADNRFALNDQENIKSPAGNPFNPLIALAGALLGLLLGASVALVITAMVGVEWPLSLVIVFHAALSFGILGAWIAASFVLDDGDDAVAITPFPVFARIPIAGSSTSGMPPRFAA